MEELIEKLKSGERVETPFIIDKAISFQINKMENDINHKLSDASEKAMENLITLINLRHKHRKY